MPITSETRLSRNGEILYAPVNAEQAVMMSLAAGRYYGLDAVGVRVWELLEEPSTIAQLRSRICQEFEVDDRTCEEALLVFAQELIDNGIACAVAS